MIDPAVPPLSTSTYMRPLCGPLNATMNRFAHRYKMLSSKDDIVEPTAKVTTAEADEERQQQSTTDDGKPPTILTNVSGLLNRKT